jgi:splicing factor 3A subunit 2
MDFQNRVGSRPGAGPMMSESQLNLQRRERLKNLALETIDISKDPYFMKNHLGSYECKLCLTLHPDEDGYLAHTQGKKHQYNLARRAAKDSSVSMMGMQQATAALVGKVTGQLPAMVQQVIAPAPPKRAFVKIGRPGYKVTKIRDPTTRQMGLLLQLQFPDIVAHDVPRYRFMSAYEQKVENPDKKYQYLLIAAEPYETVAFKIQSKEIDRSDDKLFTHWDNDAKTYWLQFFFKGGLEGSTALPPALRR